MNAPSFLEALQREQFNARVELASDQLIESIFGCMEKDGVNLEAAITMITEINTLHREYETEHHGPEVGGLLAMAMDLALVRAINEVRDALSGARELVKHDDEGSAEPKPLDREHWLARFEAKHAEMHGDGA